MGVSLSKAQKGTGTNPVNYYDVEGHFHIGANIPGFLPVSDVYCADNLGDAMEVWEDQINSLDVEDGEEYSRILHVQASIRDRDIHYRAYQELEKFRKGQIQDGMSLANLLWFIHTPDHGADINMWISVHGDERDHCLIGMDQV